MAQGQVQAIVDGTLYADAADARIGVLDRGFLYGDSVYEVMRTYGGRPYALEAHLDRLERSARALALPLPPRERIAGEMRRLVESLRGDAGSSAAPGLTEVYVRVIVTRGAGEIGLDPALAEGGPRLVLLGKPFVPLDPALYAEGVAVAIVGVRRNLRRALDPAVKSGNYLNSVLALAEARRAGAYEAVMLDTVGRVTEASTANCFAVTGGKLRTPAAEVGILEGVTRATVLRLARDVGIPVEETLLEPADLTSADEVLLTSTLRGVLPVTRIDGRPVGDGKPGPIGRRLGELLGDEARQSSTW